MKRSSLILFLPILLMTACQPATPQPTVTSQPATATVPVATPSPTIDTQEASPPNLVNQVIIEEGVCCISAQAGESLTLNIDLSSFERYEPASNMFVFSIYEPHNDPWDRADIWRVSWPGERQPFTPSTEMTFEVLPNWNTIRICASINRIETFGHEDCATIAVYGEPQGKNPGMAEFEPDKFVRGTRLELADWLSDPQVHVFSILWMQLEDRYVITFFNAETQERFDLIVSDMAGYFWSPDGEEFGLLQQYSSHVHMIDLSTGIVSSDEIDRDTIKPLLYDERNIIGFRAFPNPVPVPLFANGTDPTDPDFQLSIDETYWDSLYEFNRYLWDEDFNWTEVVGLTNRQTGEERWFTDPQDEENARSSDFSAVNNQVIVVEGQTNQDGEPIGDRLLVYAAETGALQAQYKGAFNGVSWSPDGQQILYTTYQVGVAPPNVRTPCILTVATGNTRCLADIAAHFEGREDLFVANYRWSDNGDRLFFLYWIPIHEYSSGLDSGIGNYCYYHLADGEVQCPDEELFKEQLQTIHFYTVSPDEQYISVDHSRCTDHNNYFCSMQVSVFGINNDVYIDLGYEKFTSVRLYDSWRAPGTLFVLSHSSLLWRPDLHP